MRWPGRGRVLYKLSMGGHSALVSKDHVCESGFPVRKAVAGDWGYLPCRSLSGAPREGKLRTTALGPSVLRGNQAAKTGLGERKEGADPPPMLPLGPMLRARIPRYLGPRVLGSLGGHYAVREAPALSGETRSRPSVGNW